MLLGLISGPSGLVSRRGIPWRTGETFSRGGELLPTVLMSATRGNSETSCFPDLVDEYSQRLFDALSGSLEPWLRRSFDRVVSDQNMVPRVDVHRRDAVIGDAARTALDRLRHLFETDVLEQRHNPLQIIRSATDPITAVLRDLGAQRVERDEFQQRSFPDDDFGLCPATWVDIDESLAEVGLEWGAWKAATVITRRRDRM